MRTFALSFLLASVAVPAVAADDEPRDVPGMRDDRSSQTSDDRDSHRRSEASQSDRASRQQSFERVERQERVRDGRAARFERRQESAGDAQQQQIQQVAVDRQDGERRRGFGMRQRGQDQAQPVEQGVRQDGRRDGRRFDGWRPRERQVQSVPETNVIRQVGDQQGTVYSQHNGDRRDYRSRHRDGNYNRWSQHWRNDGRYDWRRYRDRHRSIFRIGFYYDPFGWNYRRFGIGSYMYPAYFGSRYWINDPWQYRLPPAYGPYRWVRYHNDALLIDTWTGEVVDVIYGFFW